MLRCINCMLCLQRLHRNVVNELSLQMRNILIEWTALPQLPVDAVICDACYVIVHGSAGDSSPRRRLGHANVCVGCGSSVLNSRSYNLEENSPLLNVFQWSINLPVCVKNYIQGHINQVCFKCWTRGNRRIIQDTQNAAVEDELPPKQPVNPLKNEPLGAPPMPPSPPTVQQQELVTRITLPHYKRAANTSRRCVFNMCNNAAGHLVPTFIKIMLIKEYNFYIPRSARVCEIHLLNNTWHSLPEITNTISEFDANQIENIINLAKRETSFDVENVHEMPIIVDSFIKRE